MSVNQNQPISKRALRKKRRQQRQTILFTTLGIILVAVLISSALVTYGIIPTTKWDSFTDKAKYAKVGETPCIPSGVKTVELNTINAKVLNGTEKTGLATSVANSLGTLGVKIAGTGNAPKAHAYEGTALIFAGPHGVTSAYTLARLFPGSEVLLEERTDATVTVVIGSEFTEFLKDSELEQALNEEITQSDTCIEINPESLKTLPPEDPQDPKDPQEAPPADAEQPAEGAEG